jgi:hypothetical protein
VPQKPTQDQDDSNKGKEADFSSGRGDDSPHPLLQGIVRDRKACGKDHWLGGLLHNPEKQKQAGGQGRSREGVAAPVTCTRYS